MMDIISIGFVLKPTVMCLPPKKRNQDHTHARTLTSHLFLSFTYSHFSLFSLYVVMAPGYFIVGIYMFSSLTLQLYIYASSIYIYLFCDILLGIFYIRQYIFFYSYFLNFIRYNAIYILSTFIFQLCIYMRRSIFIQFATFYLAHFI